jgi:hypothetical protein
MPKISILTRVKAIVAIMAIFSLAVPAGAVQNESVHPPYKLGSPNTATADPPISHPNTQPCVVTLFSNYEFMNFNPQSFSYTPPVQCPGPWAKVILVGDFNVTAGVQYDRTGNIWIGATNIWFGTTPEPMSNFGPSWHFEKDLTDYSSLFTAPQAGTVDLFNLVNSQYTGIIYGTTTLKFYPPAQSQKAPRTADMILPLSAGPTGGTVALNTTADQLAGTFTMPTNIERAYLDVYAQGQSSDEFWYTCVPDNVAMELQSCTGTAFREAEVSIDGTPAGVAPIYPWIFTGGIDPYLWSPIPGVQTLNFTPYRVDLSPFAGLLSNGQQHTVALSVFNADSYFSATASLLLYLDSGSTQVTGAVTHNGLNSGPNPKVVEDLKMKMNGDIVGTVKVTSFRKYIISGYVDTSHGRVKTEVVNFVDFSSVEKFDITSSKYVQDINQDTTVSSTSGITDRGKVAYISQNFTYPLNLDISVAYNSDGSGVQTTTVDQQYNTVNSIGSQRGSQEGTVGNEMTAGDMLDFNNLGQITGNMGQQSSQHYTSNSAGPEGDRCYDRMIRAANGVLTGVQSGCGAK